jgi:hypothetical protein
MELVLSCGSLEKSYYAPTGFVIPPRNGVLDSPFHQPLTLCDCRGNRPSSKNTLFSYTVQTSYSLTFSAIMKWNLWISSNATGPSHHIPIRQVYPITFCSRCNPFFKLGIRL